MTAPPPSLAVQCPPPPSQPPPPCMAPVQPASVPTYEIVTSCQPSVMYSNGYYYTSFVPPPPPQAPASSTPASTPTSAPLQYSSVVSGQQVMAPQYSAVAAGGAPVQYTPAANSGSPVQYSSSSGAPPVQYTAASTVQFTPGTSVHYTTSPLPQQQYSTVSLFHHIYKPQLPDQLLPYPLLLPNYFLTLSSLSTREAKLSSSAKWRRPATPAPAPAELQQLPLARPSGSPLSLLSPPRDTRPPWAGCFSLPQFKPPQTPARPATAAPLQRTCPAPCAGPNADH